MRVAFGDFVFDSDTRELLCGGNRVTLSPKAFQLLEVLIENRPRALSKSVLHDRLWANTFVVEANLSNLVGEIRHALGEDSRTPRFVRTVPRFGYAFQCVETNPEQPFQRDDEHGSDLVGPSVTPLVFGRDRSSRNNLPQQLTRFIGRQRELAAVRSLVSQTRLTTLCGAGGIGKTRLALEVARDCLDDYADGIWLVEFASISDRQLIPQTVASALDLREECGRSMTDAVAGYLKSRNLLLVLDNCEHVIGAIAQLADILLRNCPNLRVLATSRESLAIAGETLFRVPPLSLPDAATEPDAASLGKHEAVELFVERVRAVKATFVLDESNAALVAKVCIHLEGIPLAIELAASRMKVLSIEQIAARLGHCLKLLRGGSRTALPRHQTLLAAIDWSYNLLSETEKTLFHRLSVFSGGWTLEAAENVCVGGPVERDNLLELLSGLIDKSLVSLDERDGQHRYRFMMALLEYAQERLLQTHEAVAIHRAHAGFFNGLVLEGESRSMSAGENTWLDRIKLEYDNIRSVLSWTSKEEPEAGLRLAAALWRFWYLNGYWQEGRRWLEEMLTRQPASTDGVVRAKAINRLASIAVLQGNGATAQELATQALSVARESAGRSEAAFALNTMAIIAGEQCNFSAARAFLEESLGIRRELGDQALTASTLNNLGILSTRQAEFDDARAFYEESLANFREVGDRHGMATTLLNQGELAIRAGDRSSAQLKIQEALTLAKELKDRSLIPVAMNSLGKVLLSEGNDLAASQLINETLDVFRDLGDKHRIATTLVSLGTLAEHRGCDLEAQSLYEESVARCRELGDQLELAASLNCLGRLVARQGDHATAQARHQEALRISQQVGSRPGIARSLNGLADLARLEGDYATASSLYKKSLAAWWDLSNTPESLQTLENLATVMIASGQSEPSVRILGAAQAVREAMSVPRSTHDTPDYDRQVSAARKALGETRFAALWKEGQATDSDTAIANALKE
jgi:non-specific serine/threonine protein kinase